VSAFHGQVDWKIDAQHPAKATKRQVAQIVDGGGSVFQGNRLNNARVIAKWKFVFTLALTCFLSPRRGHTTGRFLNI
jgi:hypothetical protein